MTSNTRLPRSAVVVSVLCGAAYGVTTRLMFGDRRWSGYGAMSLAFIVLVPIAVGYLAVACSPGDKHPPRKAVLIPSLTMAACLAFVLAAGLEGIICTVLVAPLFLLFGAIGGMMAEAMRKAGRRTYASGLATVLLLPYTAAPLEGRIPLPDTRRTVETRVVVRADAATVWRHVVRPTGIRPEENQTRLAHRIGFPHPVSATLSHEGLGGSRYALFERGIVLRETVTEWVPERRMAFIIDPTHVPAAALDEHVTMGGPFFDVLDGSYQIVPLDSGRVELRLTTTHRLSTHFNPYAGFWTDLLMRQIQENLLHVIRTRAEAGR